MRRPLNTLLCKLRTVELFMRSFPSCVFRFSFRWFTIHAMRKWAANRFQHMSFKQKPLWIISVHRKVAQAFRDFHFDLTFFANVPLGIKDYAPDPLEVLQANVTTAYKLQCNYRNRNVLRTAVSSCVHVNPNDCEMVALEIFGNELGVGRELLIDPI